MEPKVGFSKQELVRVQEHLDKTGPQPLPPHTTEKMFEAYLGGSSLAEVSKAFPEHSQLAIFYTAYHYNWPATRDELTLDVQSRLKQKVLYSKYKQLELVDTMIKVAHTETMQAMQTYLKHPNDRNLPKNLRIKTIKELQMAIEMISNIIGQDNMKKIDISGDINVNDDSKDKPVTTVEGALTEATAKMLLKGMNRKNDGDVVDIEVSK